ncbi:MAG: glycosyltransferase family 4 protein [Methanosphaera sp.]|nr:glycosyltransferase family 4 protein [Methanosphaera sp.]
MKIAFIYDTAFPWITGGAERRIYEIATRLVNRGHDVHIFSLGYWMEAEHYSSKEIIQYNGITYHSVGKPMDLYTENNTRSIREALYFARCILTNAELNDFDIVDCQGFPYFSCYTSKLKNRKNLVITVHEVWNDYWYEYLGKLGLFGKIIEKGIFHLTKNIICVSQLTYENMLKNKTPDNATIIANGVDTNEITFINPHPEYSDVIFAGRLIPEKHVDLIINAISKVVSVHPRVKCKIIGNGPSEAYLKQLTADLNIENNVIFEDFCEKQDELYSKIKSSSALILPSKREGFGIIVIEANACGVPVITLDYPMNAAKDLIREDNGWLVDDNPEELANLICRIIDDGVSNQQRKLCRNYAKEYDWNHIASLTEKYYYSIKK